MAYTINRVKKTVAGDLRMVILSCTADAATQAIETGLDRIYGFSISPVSMTAATVQAYPNELSLGTSAGGYLAVSGLTNLDEFHVICFGT